MSDMVGTPHFMAPEVSRTKCYTFQADVYSFAICVHEILHPAHYCGVPKGGKGIKLAADGLRPKLAQIPKGIHSLLEKMWHEDPRNRPTFVVLLSGQLEAALDSVSGKNLPDSAAPQVSSKDKLQQSCISEDVVVEEDVPCTKCGVRECNHANEMLLCDGCPAGMHMQCLPISLEEVPVGDWFCPTCREKIAAQQQPTLTEKDTASAMKQAEKEAVKVKTKPERDKKNAEKEAEEQMQDAPAAPAQADSDDSDEDVPIHALGKNAPSGSKEHAVVKESTQADAQKAAPNVAAARVLWAGTTMSMPGWIVQNMLDGSMEWKAEPDLHEGAHLPASACASVLAIQADRELATLIAA